MKNKILLIVGIIFASFLSLNVYAQGDSYDDSYTLILGEELNIHYGESDYEKFVSFVAPETRYYEFQVLNPFDNEAFITLNNSNNEELFFTGTDEGTGECIAYGYLVAGKTYYLIIHNYAESNYDLKLVARNHTHNYKLTFAFYNSVSYECKCEKEKEGVITASLSATGYTYDGKIKKPTVKVKNTAGISLKEKDNYVVTYSTGRKNVGKYKVTIKFVDAYHELDSITKSFVIKPKNTASFKVSSLKKSFKATWYKQTIQTTGYQIQYSRNKSFSNSRKVTIKGSKITSKTIKNLTSKKTYYARIRTYKSINGNYYYSNWSNIKTVKVK